jgi:hypothetical protein
VNARDGAIIISDGVSGRKVYPIKRYFNNDPREDIEEDTWQAIQEDLEEQEATGN